jgi:hypothetical protein
MTSTDETPTSTGPGTDPGLGTSTDGGPPTTCSGGAVSVDWTGDAKTCIIDEHQTYNFDTNQCTQMRQAQFPCTWDNILAALDKLGLLVKNDPSNPNHIYNQYQAGAKLVSCGESQDGNRIVAQYITISDGALSANCQETQGQHHVTTGCYTYYPNGNAPPLSTDPTIFRQQVYECMNQL